MDLVRVLAGVVPARHRIFVLVLVSVLVALVPVADASPPDPTWLTGIYDAWDFDEVVVAVVSATAVVSSVLLVSPKPADLTAGTILRKDAVLRVAPPFFTLAIRAPPSGKSIATT
jgi:hypothetical protein